MPEKQEPVEDPADSNYFSVALAAMDYGATQGQLSEGLALLVKEVAASGRVGSMSLSLKLKPTGRNGQLEVISEVKLNRPKAEPGKSLFFAGPHGELMRENPRQKNFGENFGKQADPHAPVKVAVGQ